MTKKKILSLLLALVMVLDMLPRFALPVVAEDQPEQDIVIEESTDFEDEGYITGMVRLSCDENSAQATLEQGNKIYIFTTLDSSLGEQVTYMWQMMTPDGGWATISGYVLPYAAISDALLASATLEDGAARLRCVVGAGEQKYVSQALVISRTGRVTQPEPEIQPEIGTETVEQMNVFSGRVTEEDTMGTTASDENFQIQISYIYHHLNPAPSMESLKLNENGAGTAAANAFTVTLPGNAHYTGTIATPLEVGYLPYVKVSQQQYVTGYVAPQGEESPDTFPESYYRRNYAYQDDDYVLAQSIQFDRQIQNVEITVYYIPQDVTYRVRIFEQNLYDDEYTLAQTITKTGLANAAVGANLDTPRTGFTPLYYDPNLPIAEDGSFAVDIYYDRNYYLVNFDLNEQNTDKAYGAPNSYVRYRTPVSLPTPTRPGYSFVEWTLEQVKDENQNPVTTDLYKNPAEGGYLIQSTEHNLNYKANWSVGSTSYTIIYWLENAENYNFTLDSFKVVENVRPGEVITADKVKNTLSIEDASSFVFNEKLSDVSVTVAADGTTAFNAYYLRKYYTLTFQNSSNTAMCLTPEHTVHTDKCPTGNCTLEVHSHTMECTTGNAICKKEEHVHEGCDCILAVHEHSTQTDENPAGCCTVAYHVHSGGVVQDCVKPVHEMHHATCYSLNALQEATEKNLSDAQNEAFSALKRQVAGLNNGYVYRIRIKTGWFGSGTVYNFLYVHSTWFFLGTGSDTNGSYNGVSVPGITEPGSSNNATTAAAATAICGMEVHTHGDGNCACNTPVHDHTSGCNCGTPRHVHGEGDCTCGKEVHKHEVKCYDSFKCNQTAHTHTAGCVRACQLGHSHSSDTSNNKTFMQVQCKYDSDISWVWTLVDAEFTEGQRWKANTYFSEVLVYLPYMPPTDITFTVDTGGSKNFTMRYYLEALDQEGATEYQNKFFNLKKTSTAKYGYLTEKEDFLEFVGFTQWVSDPAFSKGQVTSNSKPVDMYYTRNEYPLEFVSLGASLSAFTQMLKYQQPIGASYEVAGEDLPYPSNEEPGAIQFAGWYTTPTCADGTEFVFDDSTIMPVGGLVLYAKWVPCTYTLTVYSNSDKDAILVNPLTVPFGTMVEEPSYQNDLRFVSMGKVLTEFTQNLMLHAPIKSEHEPVSTRITPPANNAVFAGWYTTPNCAEGTQFNFDGSATMPAGGLVLYAKWTVNGDMLENPSDFEREERLIFAGWYYVEGGQEKRFDFNTMSVKQDLEIYAKWTSRIPVSYTIYYDYVCPKEAHAHVETCFTNGNLTCGKEEHTHQNEQLVSVANTTTGKSLAGISKTFYAKAGSDLNEGYRVGYYPEMRAHTMTMSSEASENVYHFRYTVPDSVTYTVTHKFTESATSTAGEDQMTRAESVFKSILGVEQPEYSVTYTLQGQDVRNATAAVLLSFREGISKDRLMQAWEQQYEKTLSEVQKENLWNLVTSLSPDAITKPLVLTTQEGSNNAVFNWSNQGDVAIYTVCYYFESVDGSDYFLDKDEPTRTYVVSPKKDEHGNLEYDEQGKLKYDAVTAELLSGEKYEHYDLNTELSNQRGTPSKISADDNGEINPGLVLNMYYSRKTYEYKVQHHKTNSTSTDVLETGGTAKYGSKVQVSDVAQAIPGYTLTNGADQVDIMGAGTVIHCYYTGLEVQYVYLVEGMGASINLAESENQENAASETVVVGTRPQARKLSLWDAGFQLRRWYYKVGEGEQTNVPSEWLSDGQMVIQPTAAPPEWAGKTITIYAELIPTTRHFRVDGFTTTANDPQAFVFNLKGTEKTPTAGIDLTFFIFDNGHLDIEQLPYGQYTLTTLSWAWRYGHPATVTFNNQEMNASSGSVTLNLNTTGEVVITYSSNNKKTQWLSDDVAGVIPTTPVQTPGQS